MHAEVPSRILPGWLRLSSGCAPHVTERKESLKRTLGQLLRSGRGLGELLHPRSYMRETCQEVPPARLARGDEACVLPADDSDLGVSQGQWIPPIFAGMRAPDFSLWRSVCRGKRMIANPLRTPIGRGADVRAGTCATMRLRTREGCPIVGPGPCADLAPLVHLRREAILRRRIMECSHTLPPSLRAIFMALLE